MPKGLLRSLCLVAAFLLVLPALASADTLLSLFGGSTTFSATGASESRTSVNYGGTLTFKKKVGVEVDFGYSNNIGGTDDLKTDNARTFMVNFIADAGPKHGRVQPYVSGGAGLIALKVATVPGLFRVTSKYNDAGIDVGGGALVSSGGRMSYRLDARYFRDLDDVGVPFSDATVHVGFVRITGGVVFRF